MNIPQLTIDHISKNLSLKEKQVKATLDLVLEGATVPFIARYRKEKTDGLDELQIAQIQNIYESLKALHERKQVILRSIGDQGKLTESLKKKIEDCNSRVILEDIYFPFKAKKRTKGQMAKEKGLDKIALHILEKQDELKDLSQLLSTKVGSFESLKTPDDVREGVIDFLSEFFSEDASLRELLRNWIFDNADLSAKAKDEFLEEKTKYTNYYNFNSKIKSILSHRFLAIRRGEKEKILTLSLDYDENTAISFIKNQFAKETISQEINELIQESCEKSFKRLLAPTLETEIRLMAREKAEEEAMRVFSRNLKNLLLLPPIPSKPVIGIDPGLRSGCKVAAVDSTGKLLEYFSIFPKLSKNSVPDLEPREFQKIKELLLKYKVNILAIGNGTGGRELESFLNKHLENEPDLNVRLFMVNEAGASIYSASDIARQEFPNLDLIFRSAVSIARRLQDPLSELVKIEPKSIGVGQYQHDVNQSLLKKQLHDVVVSCVNFVGVDVNTASASLLSYVSSINKTLASNIIKYREEHGRIDSRDVLKKIPGFGPKTFEQAAGFLHVKNSDNPLDNTSVHPERYDLLNRILSDLNTDLSHVLRNKDVLEKIELTTYVTEEVGVPTLKDIINELLKPGRDPREDGIRHHYSTDIRKIEDINVGNILTGTVTNVTNFGFFVDIGVHQDALVHISEFSHEFISDISKKISVGERVKVKVIELDKDRKRISLSIKALENKKASPQTKSEPSNKAQPNHFKKTQYDKTRQPRNFEKRGKQITERTQLRPQQNSRKANEPKKPASLNDLLEKFNSFKT